MEESEIEKEKTSTLTIDLAQEGLALCFKDYQMLLMKNLWETGIEQSSRDAWIKVNEDLQKNKGSSESGLRAKDMRGGRVRNSISRASVINFLNSMVDEKVIDYHEITGKGGHRRIYKAAMTEQDFWAYVIQVTTDRLSEASNLPLLISVKM